MPGYLFILFVNFIILQIFIKIWNLKFLEVLNLYLGLIKRNYISYNFLYFFYRYEMIDYMKCKQHPFGGELGVRGYGSVQNLSSVE